MKIVIVGIGKVGRALAEHLSCEGHNVAVIDNRPGMVQHLAEELDVLGIEGNGAAYPVQQQARAGAADLVIAATDSDEVNMIACMAGGGLRGGFLGGFVVAVQVDLPPLRHIPPNLPLAAEGEDAEHPAAERLRLPQVFQPLPRFGKGFRHRILGVLRIAQGIQGHAVQVARHALVQCAEGSPAALLCLYDLLGDRHNAPSFAAASPAVHRISAVRGGFCCVSRQNLCRGGPAVCRYFTTPRAKCKALALRGRISCWFCFLFSKGCVII